MLTVHLSPPIHSSHTLFLLFCMSNVLPSALYHSQKDQQVQTTMQQLKQQANEYGSTMEQIKAQSEKEKSAIVQFHKAEEQTLKEQIDALKKSLASQDQVAQASRSTVEEMQKQIA